jgi:hypothetical protein
VFASEGQDFGIREFEHGRLVRKVWLNYKRGERVAEINVRGMWVN